MVSGTEGGRRGYLLPLLTVFIAILIFAGGAVGALGLQQGTFMSGQFRLATQWAREQYYIRPLVDFNGGVSWLDAFTETGAGAIGLAFNEARYTYLTVTPAIEVGSEIGLYDDAVLRPFLRVGMTRYLTGDTQSVSAGFAGAPAGVAPFLNTTKLDRTLPTLDIGVDFLRAGTTVTRFDYSTQMGSKTRTQGITLKVSTAW